MFVQLHIPKNFFQVVIDGMGFDVVQNRHHFLGQPHVFIGVNRVDVAAPRRRQKRQIFGGGGTDKGNLLFFHARSPLDFRDDFGDFCAQFVFAGDDFFNVGVQRSDVDFFARVLLFHIRRNGQVVILFRDFRVGDEF